MESLELRLQALQRAVIQLQHMLKKLQGARTPANKIDKDDLLAYRDSVIKRFEICFDLLWKALKEYISKKYSIELASPKKVFQECFRQHLVNEEEARQLLAMVDDRNTTTHIYDEETAEEISHRINGYYALIKSITDRLNYA
jgi:nucleotidyltransferase substrate binding protein (TIGR01987 family)